MQKAINIYRVVRIWKKPCQQGIQNRCAVPVTQGLRTDFPQLTNAAAILWR